MPHIQFNDCVLHITTVSTSFMNYKLLLLTWTLSIRYINSKGHIPLPEPMKLININFYDEAKIVSIRNMTDIVDVRGIPWSPFSHFWLQNSSFFYRRFICTAPMKFHFHYLVVNWNDWSQLTHHWDWNRLLFNRIRMSED